MGWIRAPWNFNANIPSGTTCKIWANYPEMASLGGASKLKKAGNSSLWVYGLYNTLHQEVSSHNRELRSPTLPMGTQLNKPIKSQNKEMLRAPRAGKSTCSNHDWFWYYIDCLRQWREMFQPITTRQVNYLPGVKRSATLSPELRRPCSTAIWATRSARLCNWVVVRREATVP